MFTCKIPGWFHKGCPNRPTIGQVLIAAIGSFFGIAAVAYLSLEYDVALLVPSFGASAVLLYAAAHVPMAQPRNVMGGHLISALIGVSVFQLWGLNWWTIAMGVMLAITGMIFTNTLHPPGGATAFAAVFSQQNYSFVLLPVGIGALILVMVAFVVHNIGEFKAYPASSKNNSEESKG